MCPSVGLVDYDKFQWSRFYPQNQVYIHLFTEGEMKTVSEVDVFSLAPFMLLKISRTAKPICDRMRDSQLSRMSDRQVKQKHVVSNAKVHSCLGS